MSSNDASTRRLGWEVAEQGPGYALVGTPAGAPDGAVLEADEASLTIGVVVPT